MTNWYHACCCGCVRKYVITLCRNHCVVMPLFGETNTVRKLKLAHSHHSSDAWSSAISPSFSRRSQILRKTLLVPCMTFDQDPNIRIEGYKAIVRMSEEQLRWLERNVDVLVQLLQSDEPEEVAVIKMVLIQHLELDSKVTLGVLCDQIVPPDDPMEDEDKTIRERPEALVVAFLTHDPGSLSSRSCRTKGAVLPSKKMR
ncbi:hypothetical protein EDB85DRAFT_1198159 [Lactarius pseudohatsudake]|nr:hypothetical protein EDB85DRAFT_1198159 [Lactarius pseudohatsudake]